MGAASGANATGGAAESSDSSPEAGGRRAGSSRSNVGELPLTAAAAPSSSDEASAKAATSAAAATGSALRVLGQKLCEERQASAMANHPDSQESKSGSAVVCTQLVYQHQRLLTPGTVARNSSADAEQLGNACFREALETIISKVTELVQEAHTDFFANCGGRMRALEHRVESSEEEIFTDSGKREERDREMLAWIKEVHNEMATAKKQIEDFQWDGMRRLERLERMLQESDLKRESGARQHARLHERLEELEGFVDSRTHTSTFSQYPAISGITTPGVSTQNVCLDAVVREPKGHIAEALAAAAAEAFTSAVHVWQRRKFRQELGTNTSNEASASAGGDGSSSGARDASGIAADFGGGWRQSDVGSDKSTTATEEPEEEDGGGRALGASAGLTGTIARQTSLSPTATRMQRQTSPSEETVHRALDALEQVLRSVGHEAVGLASRLAEHEAQLEAQAQDKYIMEQRYEGLLRRIIPLETKLMSPGVSINSAFGPLGIMLPANDSLRPASSSVDAEAVSAAATHVPSIANAGVSTAKADLDHPFA